MAVKASKRENFILAECLPTDTVGKAVSIRGPESGITSYYGIARYGVSNYGFTPLPERYHVESADPTDFDKMPAVGVIIIKLSQITCVVQISGPVRDVFTGRTPGKMQFVGDSGDVVETPPVLDVPKFLQTLGTAWSDDIVGVQPDTTLTLRRPL